LAKDKATAITADANEKRAMTLFGNKVISAQERDANVAAAQSSRGSVEADTAAIKQAELNLAYTKIKAPMDSYVTNKRVAIGDYVQVGQTLMALVPPRVWVTANFKETQLRNMRPGQTATISVDAYPGLRLQGHVDSIQAGSGAAFSLLPPENATGNYVKVVQRVPVKIVFDQKPNSQHVLGPGMSVVPSVQVTSGFGAAIKVIVGTALLIAIVIIGAALWIGKIRHFE
jgi:membrane fusion protein (multidrug efflux system)